ncbi:divalent-cation tolerance protein CutA [Aliarcobacter cryaerophilus]|jgi:periplasmic divalent cation tolerance protein|uniref:Divalent-cation tolerance protein CutA n=4 Tax=Arcobacteraceae TaxID=2808963 RepID=A0AAU0P4T0_9BACT|nr:divalent-cation tolerance protein CutA [Aliarcobacter cryaerophilus]MBK6303787.1 divalent-cation tolerance protein CutA [Arcobacter sp.]NCB10578.1 divalent-cation tolerance protein CutA [Erysipelotrichia bacterium]OQA76397.1 MAG: Divalent-cation tolerance protein CutA [Candidatus Dependentiae bacterium ADurb.Bin246]PRM92969.1 divalent-cation tolerance protein CutA [Arcobacter cryaerophilus gv. occultus]WNL16578.1 divalent-cation tolerance protein CutA [Arcobacter sp. AZ-2023]WPD03691.1 div
MKAVIVQTTTSNEEEAKKIAKILIQDKLAACVQLKDIESLYNWDGKLCCERETLLSIKTKKELFSKVKSKILELHSYDTPEIIELDISNISEDYLKFIKENTI